MTLLARYVKLVIMMSLFTTIKAFPSKCASKISVDSLALAQLAVTRQTIMFIIKVMMI